MVAVVNLFEVFELILYILSELKSVSGLITNIERLRQESVKHITVLCAIDYDVK
jgi:hypothetical protein